MRRWIIVSLLSVVGCGSPEEELRSLSTLTPVQTGDSINDLVTTPMNTAFSQSSDCVFSSGQCPGIYSFPMTYTTAKKVTAKIRAYWDSTAWTTHNPPFGSPGALGFSCRFQTCAAPSSQCQANALMKDLSHTYWIDGDVEQLTIQPATAPATASAPQTFEIMHNIPANTAYRIFCNYHWLLDDVEATRPRIVETTRQNI